MGNLTLGLDLGPTSVGWALVDEEHCAIVATGVRVFPEGVDRDASGAEQSKSQQRRIARAMRRQIARRSRRKRKLRQLLHEAGLIPQVATRPAGDPDRVQWEGEQFQAADPYALRRKALTERLTAHELGRVLMHLNQRRGFLSNRKTDRERKKESSELLAEISQLERDIHESGSRTLAEYLARQRGDEPALFHRTRLRGRHTRRDMYQREFDAVWAAQQRYHPDRLTDEFRQRVRDVIFFQRPLRPPGPGLVGRCELEPRLPRCPRADRRFQRFRLFQEISNLKVLDTAARSPARSLTHEERERLIAYLRSGKERSFDQIRKHLFQQHESVRFNLEEGGRGKLLGMRTDASLASKGLLGPKWHKAPEDLKDRIVAAIIDDDAERLGYLLNQACFGPEMAERVLEETDLESGYASYSLHAIKKLLPHVAAGLPLTTRDPNEPCALRAAGYQMPWERAAEKKPFLDKPPAVTNPLVRAALHEVRKVVNGVLREYIYWAGHTLGAIHIELAREVRGTAAQRRKLSLEMHDRERQRDAAAARIREFGKKPTRGDIERYLLWEEQGHECIYSGRPISLAQLLEGEADVDHVLPYSRSLDNSRMNRVIAFRAENAAKGDRTPYEWLAGANPDKYEQVLQRAKRLPFPKLRRFHQETVDLEDFFSRQFQDTAYITTQVRQYLACLGADILCPKGAHTAELRRHWGLNTILRSDEADLKNRDDHRHHAVDAIVVALTNRSRLQQLAAIARQGGTDRTGEVLPDPWDEFRQQAGERVNSIIVSYRVRRRVSGALHKETVYGRAEATGEYVVRKPLESLTPAMAEKIRDPVVRSLVAQRLGEFGIKLGRGGGKIPAEVWKEPLYMPARNADRRPLIRSVRIVVPSDAIVPIRGGASYVDPGNTHHVCLFEISENGKTRKDAVFVSMLEALRRVRDREPIIQPAHPAQPAARFLMSLSGNELLLLRHEGREDFYRFDTAASTSKQMWFRHHTFAGKSSDKRLRVSKKPGTFEGKKVTVDPIGRVRWAND